MCKQRVRSKVRILGPLQNRLLFIFFYYCEVDIDDEDIDDESLPVVCFLLRVYEKHSSFFMFHAYIRHVEQLCFSLE